MRCIICWSNHNIQKGILSDIKQNQIHWRSRDIFLGRMSTNVYINISLLTFIVTLMVNYSISSFYG